MLLTIYRILYKITNNRKWVLKYIDLMDKRIKKEIEEVRNAMHD